MRYSRSDIVYILASVVLAWASSLGSAEPYKSAGIWFFGLCALVLLIQPWVPRRKQSNAVTIDRVEFDEREIRRLLPDGKMESIRWDELHEIGIVTTDEGPWAEDVFWLFSNADQSQGCAVPNGADGFPALLSRIQALPEFDNEAVVLAMGSAANDRFVVWRAQTKEAVGA